MRDKCKACGKFIRPNHGLVCSKCFDDWFSVGKNFIPEYIEDMEQCGRYIILACKKNNKLKK